MKSQLTFVAAALVFAGAAWADDVGQHPAVFAPRALPSVDASTFIVGHPASPTWARRTHANFDHPAVVQARLAASHGIDANTFVVQPPASVAWVTASSPSLGEAEVAGKVAAMATRVGVALN